MNGFLNGIMQVWQKLPQQSKSVIVDNLSVKQKNLINLGSQIMQYYVDVNHQNPNQNNQEVEPTIIEDSPKVRAKRGPTRRRNVVNNQSTSAYQTNASGASDEEDDDVIEAVWNEKK